MRAAPDTSDCRTVNAAAPLEWRRRVSDQPANAFGEMQADGGQAGRRRPYLTPAEAQALKEHARALRWFGRAPGAPRQDRTMGFGGRPERRRPPARSAGG